MHLDHPRTSETINCRHLALAGLMPRFMAALAMADIVWDEDIDGSLSTDRFNITDFGPWASAATT